VFDNISTKTLLSTNSELNHLVEVVAREVEDFQDPREPPL
jgi:hypothetical protein